MQVELCLSRNLETHVVVMRCSGISRSKVLVSIQICVYVSQRLHAVRSVFAELKVEDAVCAGPQASCSASTTAAVRR